MVFFFLFKIQNGKWHFAFQIGIWNGFIWNSYPALLITVFALERSFILFINNFYKIIPNYILFSPLLLRTLHGLPEQSIYQKQLKVWTVTEKYFKIFIDSRRAHSSEKFSVIFPCSQAYSRSHKLFRTLICTPEICATVASNLQCSRRTVGGATGAPKLFQWYFAVGSRTISLAHKCYQKYYIYIIFL